MLGDKDKGDEGFEDQGSRIRARESGFEGTVFRVHVLEAGFKLGESGLGLGSGLGLSFGLVL